MSQIVRMISTAEATHDDESSPREPERPARPNRGHIALVDASFDPFKEDLKTQVQRYEAELIVAALKRCNWNQTEAAKRLRMPRRTLVHKIKHHGIRRPQGG